MKTRTIVSLLFCIAILFTSCSIDEPTAGFPDIEGEWKGSLLYVKDGAYYTRSVYFNFPETMRFTAYSFYDGIMLYWENGTYSQDSEHIITLAIDSGGTDTLSYTMGKGTMLVSSALFNLGNVRFTKQ